MSGLVQQTFVRHAAHAVQTLNRWARHDPIRFLQGLIVALLIVGCASAEKSQDKARLLDAVPVVENPDHGEKDYIPQDLYDAINHLKKLLQPEQIQEMKDGSEKEMARYHHGLGTWMRNSWGLWRGSSISEWFNSIGIEHPDDMSGIILDSLWRDLNGQDLRLKEQVEHYKAYWKYVEEVLDNE